MIKISSLLSLSFLCAVAIPQARCYAQAGITPDALALTQFSLTLSKTESLPSSSPSHPTTLDRSTKPGKACSIRTKQRCQLKSQPDETSTDSRESSSPFDRMFDKLIGCNPAKSPTHCKGS